MSVTIKRATIKLKTPNPLFEKWIAEWIDETANSGNVARSNKLKNALDSLKKFPLVLKSGKECMILENFDTNLCVQLDRKLVSQSKSQENIGTFNGDEDAATLSLETNSNVECCSTARILSMAAEEKEKKNKKKLSEQKLQNKKTKLKEYLPAYRTAAYALLLTLLKNEASAGYKGFMTKCELLKEAQPLSDTSLKKVQTGSFYTGWSSMTQLVTKGLVIKTSNPARFSLSEDGKRLASRLNCSETPNCEQNFSDGEPPSIDKSELTNILAPVSLRSKKQDAIMQMEEESGSSQSVINDVEDVVFSPGTFDTILLVDTAETSGMNRVDDATISELTATGVKFEVRHLKVGDFIWICRSRESSFELVLPFIVERKRMDDLSKSIMDGRFHEQKFRLKKCGVYNIIYLIEDTGGQKYGLPLSSLYQGINNTMVTDEFTVKITHNHCESMMYLATVTTTLSNMFSNKVLFSCKESEWSLDIMEDTVFLLPFKTFISGMGKSRNFMVKEMFVKQLVQLHGLSADKAWALANVYSTPAALISAMNSSSVPSELLCNIQYGILNRKIGPVISKQLHQFYTQLQFKD